jgi:hypothetical protein
MSWKRMSAKKRGALSLVMLVRILTLALNTGLPPDGRPASNAGRRLRVDNLFFPNVAPSLEGIARVRFRPIIRSHESGYEKPARDLASPFESARLPPYPACCATRA